MVMSRVAAGLLRAKEQLHDVNVANLGCGHHVCVNVAKIACRHAGAHGSIPIRENPEVGVGVVCGSESWGLEQLHDVNVANLGRGHHVCVNVARIACRHAGTHGATAIREYLEAAVGTECGGEGWAVGQLHDVNVANLNRGHQEQLHEVNGP